MPSTESIAHSFPSPLRQPSLPVRRSSRICQTAPNTPPPAEYWLFDDFFGSSISSSSSSRSSCSYTSQGLCFAKVTLSGGADLDFDVTEDDPLLMIREDMLDFSSAFSHAEPIDYMPVDIVKSSWLLEMSKVPVHAALAGGANEPSTNTTFDRGEAVKQGLAEMQKGLTGAKEEIAQLIQDLAARDQEIDRLKNAPRINGRELTSCGIRTQAEFSSCIIAQGRNASLFEPHRTRAFRAFEGDFLKRALSC
eukprot:1150103-Rhodomonas_salina.1